MSEASQNANSENDLLLLLYSDCDIHSTYMFGMTIKAVHLRIPDHLPSSLDPSLRQILGSLSQA